MLSEELILGKSELRHLVEKCGDSALSIRKQVSLVIFRGSFSERQMYLFAMFSFSGHDCTERVDERASFAPVAVPSVAGWGTPTCCRP